ncbi:hypothetical protein E2320_006617, partial [Naja naja]
MFFLCARFKAFAVSPNLNGVFFFPFAFSGAWHVSRVRVRNILLPAAATDLGNLTRGGRQLQTLKRAKSSDVKEMPETL